MQNEVVHIDKPHLYQRTALTSINTTIQIYLPGGQPSATVAFGVGTSVAIKQGRLIHIF